MARTSFPTDFEVEYRGLEAASTFPDRTTGEVIHRPPTLKLERELPDGDVVSVEVAMRDTVDVDFEPDDLRRGETLRLVGEVMCWSGKNGGGYFLQPTSVKRTKPAAVAPIAGAKS